MNEKHSPRKLLLVGAGGIGTQLADLLVSALRRVNLKGEITLMDGDIVEPTNLGHQRYTADDIGSPKVMCLTKRLDDKTSSLRVKGLIENLRSQEQLQGFDFIAVCVDRPEPRRLVHNSSLAWLDVRCSGDGWMVLSTRSAQAHDTGPRAGQLSGRWSA